MDAVKLALFLLPDDIKSGFCDETALYAEEVRLRVGYRPFVIINGCERNFSQHVVTGKDILCILERATDASIHAVSAQLAEGYVNYCGLRIGVCGTAVMRDGAVATLKNYSSLAIRIPREVKGICENALNMILKEGFDSTLFLSPPGGGKTTALRETIRRLSESSYRVSVIDERNELAVSGIDGISFQLGEHSDVLTGVDKERGAMMLLRGMNPQIIAMDEITKPADIKTIMTIYGCGVKLLASAHAKDLDDLLRRPLYKKLLDIGVFKYFIEISGEGFERKYTLSRQAS